MATVVNARDLALEAVSPRIVSATLPPNITVPSSNVDGLPELYTSSKAVVLKATSLVFQVPKVGAVNPTSITLVADLKNITGTVTWTVTDGTVSLNVSGNTATIVPSGMSTNTATIQASVAANSTTYTDQITIAKLAEGADGVVGLLSNEAMTVGADASGVVNPTDLSAAGGTFFVFAGLTNKTGTSDVTYSVVSETGVDVSIAPTGVYTVNSVSADTGTATLRAVIAGLTIDKVYSIAKSKAGVSGTNGQRGTVNIARAITGSVWLDSEAAAALSSNGYGSPQVRDIVTLYNTSNSFSQAKFWDGSAWQTLDAYVNGNMLVTGTVAANKLNVTQLSSITADIGTCTAGTFKGGKVIGGAFTGWAWPAAGNYGYYLGPEGLLMGNNNNGKYVQITQDGQFYAPGLSIVNGSATFSGALSAATGSFSGSLTASAINAVNTINIAGQAVTIPVSVYTAGGVSNWTGYISLQSASINSSGAPIFILFSAFMDNTNPNAYQGTVRLLRDGAQIYSSSVPGNYSGQFCLTITDTPGAGAHTYDFQYALGAAGYGASNTRSMCLLEAKR